MGTSNPICLIIPPSAFLLDERVFAYLVNLKIAAVLEKANYEVEVVDLSGIKDYTEILTTYLQTSESTVFGITATTQQMPQITEIASVLSSEELLEERSRTEKEVRTKLNISFNSSRASLQFKHSIGQMSELPDFIVKRREVVIEN